MTQRSNEVWDGQDRNRTGSISAIVLWRRARRVLVLLKHGHIELWLQSLVRPAPMAATQPNTTGQTKDLEESRSK